ncbi:hypothetical protein P3T76_006487 [Phytophthora citrophthora]|uniref:Major facilitator superfamily (MFS) profile domain-containing protein n=1 Tax=Phytophthora citrophthora TaxID=4793 RepID=A0AAD9GPE3_9STRA|nr:hypothetical protein P3T76_006487 [Phytophthora citrophthora]
MQMPAIGFFFAHIGDEWHCMVGFPIVLAGICMLLSLSISVESLAWLLMQSRRGEAKQVITRLYDEELIHTTPD